MKARGGGKTGTKPQQPKKTRGPTFHSFFESIYGAERFTALAKAMADEPPKVALLNRHSRLRLEEMFPADEGWHVKPISGTLNATSLLKTTTSPSPASAAVAADDAEQNNNNNNNNNTKTSAPTTTDQQDQQQQQESSSNLVPLQEYRLPGGIRYVAYCSSSNSNNNNSNNNNKQHHHHHQLLPTIIKRDDRGTPAYYMLDVASLVVVDALAVEPHHKVCDLCAAPGGKSVAIGQTVLEPGQIVSNEPDAPRRARLDRVVADYLGTIVPHKVSGRDATNWHQPEFFDRVLVDAPCGSERHLIHQGKSAVDSWSANDAAYRSKTQASLLMRAFETVKIGGRVVYSTCSIHPGENDGVVEDALSKTRCNVQVEKITFSSSPSPSSSDDFFSTLAASVDRTRCGGVLLLPDRCQSAGPMFICVFTRLEGARKTEVDLELSTSDDDDVDDDEKK